jgi:hypothetical protein
MRTKKKEKNDKLCPKKEGRQDPKKTKKNEALMADNGEGMRLWKPARCLFKTIHGGL